jgi:hypothetical protein
VSPKRPLVSRRSGALAFWLTGRHQRLVELYAAHAAVGGRGPGRRTATRQINASLALGLAAEFQGFARDLHDESIFCLAATAVTPDLRSVLQATFTLDRKLDRGNANRSSLQQDFRRIGIPIIDRVRSMSPRAGRWLDDLDQLNAARNAIAHSEPAKLTTALNGAPGVRLQDVRRWHASVDQLAVTMDRVTAAELAVLTGGGAPW